MVRNFVILLIMGTLCSQCAAVTDILCDGRDVKTFSNYVRLIADTDEFEDVDFSATCKYSKVNELNKDKNYIIDFGFRLSDTIKHDENDNDYLLIDMGPVTIQANIDSLFVKTKTTEKTCNVPIFQNEQSKFFSHDNVFYIRIIFKNKNFQVMYTEHKSAMWQMCNVAYVEPIEPRRFNIKAYSEYGINMDIVSFTLNPTKNPWALKETVEKVNSALHKVEHAQEIDKLHKNVTKKEIKRVQFSITLLWYYNAFIATVLLAMCLKYKKDKRKMHLL